ncbi:unnamed protein product [Phytophthora fragariaefolia]|uniref:Unnamed protein product n=1 Tax=Phytophthora fragariaefolia TaxID=1490495 RepID=A0A9W7CUL3_9STRA|nr:unnamed protein product [Phytophthora fragariaefolia]
MVTPTPKTPRQQPTEVERRLCLGALDSDRHRKDVGHEKNASRKAPAKCTTSAMFAQSKGLNPYVDAATLAGIVTSVDVAVLSTPEHPPAASPSSVAQQRIHFGKPKKTSSERSQKRRRSVLQDSSEEKEAEGDDEEEAGAVLLPHILLPCVVDGDANMMSAGAEQCTGLNSDEDPALQEENDDEEDDDWEEDLNIGGLTVEDSDEGYVDLPESLCSLVAMNKKTMSMMRTNGWE